MVNWLNGFLNEEVNATGGHDEAEEEVSATGEQDKDVYTAFFDVDVCEDVPDIFTDL